MEVPALQTVDDTEIDQRNVVLFMALGAVSFSQKLAKIMGDSATTSVAERPGDELILFGLLGVIALREQLMSAISEAAEEPKPTRSSRIADDVPALRGLLR